MDQPKVQTFCFVIIWYEILTCSSIPTYCLHCFVVMPLQMSLQILFKTRVYEIMLWKFHGATFNMKEKRKWRKSANNQHALLRQLQHRRCKTLARSTGAVAICHNTIWRAGSDQLMTLSSEAAVSEAINLFIVVRVDRQSERAGEREVGHVRISRSGSKTRQEGANKSSGSTYHLVVDQ